MCEGLESPSSPHSIPSLAPSHCHSTPLHCALHCTALHCTRHSSRVHSSSRLRSICLDRLICHRINKGFGLPFRTDHTYIPRAAFLTRPSCLPACLLSQ
ncbi:hypothetical protein KC19_VG340400 [Ceratodon purpureus]|uniref:Uncharacterized protein n=1 Tax=Ceratodon purpureus TaxID=3225 RepID=A0A8T0HX60_CERPU|nr:hypothetical protein KC19_VG340400 [Ceratodon purpureus]